MTSAYHITNSKIQISEKDLLDLAKFYLEQIRKIYGLDKNGCFDKSCNETLAEDVSEHMTNIQNLLSKDLNQTEKLLQEISYLESRLNSNNYNFCGYLNFVFDDKTGNIVDISFDDGELLFEPNFNFMIPFVKNGSWIEYRDIGDCGDPDMIVNYRALFKDKKVILQEEVPVTRKSWKTIKT